MDDIYDGMIYCLTHEKWTHPQLMDYVPDDCVFVTSTPPELPADWIENVQEPSDEELRKMNLLANELTDDIRMDRL